MDLNFLVHRVSSQHVPTRVSLPDGQSVMAPVEHVEVELTPEDPKHGTFKLAFVGELLHEIWAKFVPGQNVKVTVVPEEPPVPAEGTTV